jgi:hypothetical protein
MVLVGREHPAAVCRNYAYGHTLAYYDFHGELPGDEWTLHHHDDDKQNNAPSNLEPRLRGDHSRHHLTSKRAKEIGAKGGRKVARMKRRAQREQLEATRRRKKKTLSPAA